METTQILAHIDSEIERLQQVKALLTGTSNGRFATTTAGSFRPHKKRHLSAEARERIAAAQRKRWAKLKKATT
jgi:hypothetical protein